MKKSLIFVVCLLLIVFGLNKASSVYAEEDVPSISCEGDLIVKEQTTFGYGLDPEIILKITLDEYYFDETKFASEFDTLKQGFKTIVNGQEVSGLIDYSIKFLQPTFVQLYVSGTLNNPLSGKIKFVIPTTYTDYEGESFDLECETNLIVYGTNSAIKYNENYSRSYEIGNVLDVNSANNLFRINAIDDQFTLNNLSIGDTLTTVHGLSMKAKDYDRDHGSIIQWIDVYFEGTVETECTNENVNPTLPSNYFKFAANDLVVGNELKITVTDPNKNQTNDEPTYYEETYVEPEVPIMGIDG